MGPGLGRAGELWASPDPCWPQCLPPSLFSRPMDLAITTEIVSLHPPWDTCVNHRRVPWTSGSKASAVRPLYTGGSRGPGLRPCPLGWVPVCGGVVQSSVLGSELSFLQLQREDSLNLSLNLLSRDEPSQRLRPPGENFPESRGRGTQDTDDSIDNRWGKTGRGDGAT